MKRDLDSPHCSVKKGVFRMRGGFSLQCPSICARNFTCPEISFFFVAIIEKTKFWKRKDDGESVRTSLCICIRDIHACKASGLQVETSNPAGFLSKQISNTSKTEFGCFCERQQVQGTAVALTSLFVKPIVLISGERQQV